MNVTWRVAGAFILALVATDTVASMATNWLRSPEFAFSALQALWLDAKAGPEALEAAVLAVVFCATGAGLATALPEPFARLGPALALGAGYSLVLFVFVPWPPGGRGSVEPFWVLALASAPYYVPAVASATGALLVGLLARRKLGQHAT